MATRSDVTLLRSLLEDAERVAREEGRRPAAEHLLTAALRADDDAARRVLGFDEAALRAALRADADDALRRTGVIPPSRAYSVLVGLPRAFRGAPSLGRAVRRMHARARRAPGGLTVAHAALAAIEPSTGPVARALARLGVDRDAILRDAGEGTIS